MEKRVERLVRGVIVVDDDFTDGHGGVVRHGIAKECPLRLQQVRLVLYFGIERGNGFIGDLSG